MGCSDGDNYSRGKLSFDPSGRSLAQDLDLGRQAAAQKEWDIEHGEALLPRLWDYSYRRCNLATQADGLPLATFPGLILVGREQEAIAESPNSPN